jgi:hypothetical protein
VLISDRFRPKEKNNNVCQVSGDVLRGVTMAIMIYTQGKSSGCCFWTSGDFWDSALRNFFAEKNGKYLSME